MKIRISDISPEGLKVNDTILLAPLNKRMATGRGGDIVFTEPPAVSFVVQRTPLGAVLKGEARSKYTQACSWCLKDVPRDISASLDVILRHGLPQEAGRPDKALEEDIGIIYFEGDQIELEDFIQESLILKLDLYWHPSRDASGRCSFCHEKCVEKSESSFGTNLRSLLSQRRKN